MLQFSVHLALFMVVIISSISVSHTIRAEECKCACMDTNICDTLSKMRDEIVVNTKELTKWSQLYSFVLNLRDNWQDDIANVVRRAMQESASEVEILPKPEHLIGLEKESLPNSNDLSKPPEGELVKNVSNLLAKVEMVENRTMEVEEELKSERRVRRHLEEKVEVTQTSLMSLEDQLQNFTGPHAPMNKVQIEIFSTIDDMNRTIYEDHLKTLYYKVDGVVYQKEIRKLDERIEHMETEIHDDSNSSIISKLSENVKNLEENIFILNNTIGNDIIPQMAVLEVETLRKDAAEGMEDKMSALLNDTDFLNRQLSNVLFEIEDLRSFGQKLENFSEEWTKSLEYLKTQVEVLKNETSARSISNYVDQQLEDLDDVDDVVVVDRIVSIPSRNNSEMDEEKTTTAEYEDSDTPTITNIITIGGFSDTDNSTCDVPVIEDPHLLADVEMEPDGSQRLVFGCRPIGRYFLDNPPVPPRCENGSWKGPYPLCSELSDEFEIELIAQKLKEEHPCLAGSGEFPDPIHCSRFFKCAHGKATMFNCQTGLHFSPREKVCDYPLSAGCMLFKTESTRQLLTFIPPIHIQPNNLDKPSSLLGTGTTGQLIVHPRSSFTLHCLYPENAWGKVEWEVAYAHTETIKRNLTTKEGNNRVSLTVTAATEEDSGLYRCKTPFGSANFIHVQVKAVLCPHIPLDEEYEDVFYRPTPEGEQRILGTTAEFPCEGEKRINAVCMANGKWSRELPGKNECSLKKRKSDDSWKCKPLDISKHLGLILERDDSEKVIRFKCAGRLMLYGNSLTRCRDDGYWSHTALPSCV